MLDAQGLDFALGQMERACVQGHRRLTPEERALGVAVRLQLMPTGRLESAELVSLDQFLNSFLKLAQHPDVGLRREQIRGIQVGQLEVMKNMSSFSLDLKAKFEAGLVTEAGLMKEFSDFFRHSKMQR